MQNDTLILAELDQIHKSIDLIRGSVDRIRASISPPPAPLAPQIVPVQLGDPFHISRALRGGTNEFLADGSMRVTYPANEAEGGILVKVNYARRVRAEFDLLFEAPFDFPQGLKIFRIQSFDESIGLNNWDVILNAMGSADQAKINPMTSIEAARNAGAWWGGAKFAFREGVWYRVAVELKKGDLITPKSGAFRVLVDDQKILDLPEVEVIRGGGRFSDGQINRLHFGGWYSNGAHSNPTPNPAAPAAYRIRSATYTGE